MRQNQALLFFGCVLLAACGTKAIKPSDKHIQQTPEAARHDSDNIPQTSKNAVVLPPPKPVAKVATYTVVFSSGVPVRDVLFELARDQNINIDIKDGNDRLMTQPITLNAVNQTLPQIMERIAKQADIRYEVDGNGNWMVMPDRPFMKTYKIDFINMSRSVKSSVFTSSQIGGATTGATTTGTTAGGNTALTSVTSETKNNLMDSVVENVRAIITDEDRIRYTERVELQAQNAASARGMGSASASGGITSGSKGQPGRTGGAATGTGNEDVTSQSSSTMQVGKYEPAVNINANKETGVLIVRATGRQHQKIQEFIDRVMSTARRQVLIEATIAEVTLNSNYQQGIDWSRLRGTARGFQVTQAGTTGLPASQTGQMLLLNYINPTSALGNLSASVSLLDSFGDVKVLSSPKLSVMNNQTATLKVVDNRVYFTISVTPGTTTGTTITAPTYTSTAVPVAVGFTMNVTPEINDADYVTINVRPTITRIIGYVNDPNPSLAFPCGTGVSTCSVAPIVNRVPELRTREMESIIRVNTGQIAVLGGLMQDEINNQSDGIPVVDDIPGVGNLFKNRNDTKNKTELVIFLRPVVIKDASLDGDYSAYRSNLPDANFLKPENEKAKP